MNRLNKILLPLLLLSFNYCLLSQPKVSAPVKHKYISILSGADYNLKTKTTGLHVKAMLPTKSRFDLSLSFANFSNTNIKEQYYGFGVNGNILHKKHFIISPGILFEYNIWETFFLYNNPLARKKTALASPNLWTEYNYRSFKVANQTGYNLIWGEWRTQILFGLNIGYFFKPHHH